MASKERKEWIQDIISISEQNISDKKDLSEKQDKQNRQMMERRNLYLSPESIALDAYILGGICFRISDRCKENVKFKIITRAKSKSSSLKKQERYNDLYSQGLRKNKKIHDFIASKLILREVGSDLSDVETFSNKVKTEYSARRNNTYLLASIINFFEEQEKIGEFYPEFDREDKKAKKQMDLEVCQKTFKYVKNNISKHNEKIGKSEVWRPNLEEYINQAIKELREEDIDEKVNNKYTTIKKFLTAEQTLLQDTKDYAEQTLLQDTKDYQEEYFKYLIALLYNLKKAEYKECENSYKRIDDALKTSLLTFADLIENGFNNNVTVDYLKDLARWSDELNERLSDKLESQIIEELMDDSMSFEFIDPNLSVYLKENQNRTVSIEKNIKANGYVSLHCDIMQIIEDAIELNIELQGMTAYRNDVATFGTASYGEKRLGANKFDKQAAKEKERPMHLMPKYEPEKKYTDKDGNLKPIIVIEQIGNLHKISEKDIKKWKKMVEDITPRYFSTEYNKETDSVEFTFHSIFESSKKYYTEINNRVNRKAIREGFEIIDKENLLDKNEKTIVLTREDYKNFFKNGGLEKLVGKIKAKYDDYKEKNMEQNTEQNTEQNIEQNEIEENGDEQVEL